MGTLWFFHRKIYLYYLKFLCYVQFLLTLYGVNVHHICSSEDTSTRKSFCINKVRNIASRNTLSTLSVNLKFGNLQLIVLYYSFQYVTSNLYYVKLYHPPKIPKLLEFSHCFTHICYLSSASNSSHNSLVKSSIKTLILSLSANICIFICVYICKYTYTHCL